MESYKNLDQIQEDILHGKTSVSALVEMYLKNIEAQQKLNAFLEVFADEAIQKAKMLDQKIQEKSSLGKLFGLIIGLKDNICYEGHKISAASKILENFESLYSATAVQRLIDEDAIIIGRLNCDEFAMGSSNENSAYGNVLNPLDNTKVPGGSSGGSASAVAANLCHATLGSDTGGSIRQPASFTGTVGFKPTYGAVSRHGLIAYASSFDQIGPFTRSVEDAARIYDVISGKDEFDGTLDQEKRESTFPIQPSSQKKIGYIEECLEMEGMDPEIKSSIYSYIEKLKKQGHTVEPVSFPYLKHVVPTYYVLTTAEASSNLARYDGVHFGYLSENATDIESTYIKSRSEGFGEEVKRRIMTGTFVLSAGYYDAYYGKGQKVRRLIQDKTNELLDNYDFILSPTTPTTAFDIGKKSDDPIAMYLQDIFTVQSNLAGTPSISVPLFTHSNGLPFGLQIMNGFFKEKELLSFASDLMQDK